MDAAGRTSLVIKVIRVIRVIRRGEYSAPCGPVQLQGIDQGNRQNSVVIRDHQIAIKVIQCAAYAGEAGAAARTGRHRHQHLQPRDSSSAGTFGLQMTITAPHAVAAGSLRRTALPAEGNDSRQQPECASENFCGTEVRAGGT